MVVPDGMAKARLYLNFGPGKPVKDESRAMGYRVDFESPVREAAAVYVNRKLAVTVWAAPY